MKQLRSKMLTLLVIFAMIITLIPLDRVEAAGQYFTFTSFSTDPVYPSQVNQKNVDLVGTFNGVSSDSINYKIEEIVNGQAVRSSNGNGAAPITENGNTFKFLNIQLFTGLNRITMYGTNSSGNQVSDVCYVNYSNAPVVYDVQVVETGKPLQAGVPMVVGNQKVNMLLKAPNATRVAVNGQNAYGGTDNNFVVNDFALRPGLNNLAIVAYNDTNTFTLDRQIVYYNGYPTLYDSKLTDAGTSVSIEGTPTVGPNQADGLTLRGHFQSKIIFSQEQGFTAPATLSGFTVNVTRPTSGTVSYPLKVTLNSSDPEHVVYDVTTDDGVNAPLDFTVDGNNTINVQGTYGLTNSQQVQFPQMFTYRTANSPYMGTVSQIYGFDKKLPLPVAYTSSTLFNQGSMLFEAPIWLEAKINNFTPNQTQVQLQSTPNGAAAPSGLLQYVSTVADDGASSGKVARVQFKITNLPPGEQQLSFNVVNCPSGVCGPVSDVRSYAVTFVPTPSIQLTNIYHTKVFADNATKADMTAFPNVTPMSPKLFYGITGRLVNFNLAAGGDQSTVKVKINGREEDLLTHGTIAADGSFTFKPLDPAGDPDPKLILVPGPNTITFSGVANGTPVSTTITVYLFGEDTPAVTEIFPVPYDPILPGALEDTAGKFKETGKNTFTTNERMMDVRFAVANPEKVIVRVDGVQKAIAEMDNDDDPNNAKCTIDCTLRSRNTVDLIVDPKAVTNSRDYTLRLRKDVLPTSGTHTVEVQVVDGTANVTAILTVTRELSPYVILSPKLPNEQVINQNFLPVAIQAEGADQVLIGKDAMKKDSDDIFRMELPNLKVGKNTIKFTVVRGTQKLNGSFDVNYAGSNTLGAQYKTTIPASGQVKVFNGDMTLKFPKNTLLRPMNTDPDQDYDGVDLFDKQNLFFGIADRQDGRTMKKYNDGYGNISEVPSTSMQRDLLREMAHFGYASNLFWVDAGYFKSVGQLDQYETVDGKPPFYMERSMATVPPTDVLRMVFSRTTQWMEPSQRGTITLKYDKNIRDGIAPRLTVMRYDGMNWLNIGGVVDAGKQEITAPFDGFGYYAVFTELYSYPDIAGHTFARNQLELLDAKGYMLPKDNNEFGVYEQITRGEFATMLVKLLDLPLTYSSSNKSFSDVAPLTNSYPWDWRYIETAARLGIVRGTAPKIFEPNGRLTREQAAVMIASALETKLGTPEKDLAALQKAFTDANTVNYYAISSVLAVQKANIITGRANELTGNQKKPTYRFDPQAFLNRGEAAVIAERILKNLKRL